MAKINNLVKLEGIYNDDFFNNILNIDSVLLSHISEKCVYDDMYILSNIKRFLNEDSTEDFIQSLVDEDLCNSQCIMLLFDMINSIKDNESVYDIKYLISSEKSIQDKMSILRSCLYFNTDDILVRIYKYMLKKNNISYVILGEISNQLLMSNEDADTLYASFCFSEDDYIYSERFVDDMFKGISEIYSLGSDKKHAAREWYVQTFGCEYEEALSLIERTIDIDWEKNFDNVFSDMNVLELDGKIYARYY